MNTPTDDQHRPYRTRMKLWTRLRHRRCNGQTEDAVLTAHHAETTQRARNAITELVRNGYHVGPPPYGYRALRIRITTDTGHGAFRIVLVPDWRTAAVVVHIFSLRVDEGLGFAAIAHRLNNDLRRHPTPSGSGKWSAAGVRRVVTNPRYTGRQVWARTVAGQPVPIEQWVTSKPMVHEPLVDETTFQRAQHGASASTLCAQLNRQAAVIPFKHQRAESDPGQRP